MQKKSSKTISILGCGWVGKALYHHLKPSYLIKASVQSESSFKKLEVPKKYILNPDNHFKNNDFYKTNVLIISLPPRGDYLSYLNSILQQIQSSTQLILLSSTSVYTQTSGIVNEKDTKNIEKPSLMLQGERLVQKHYPDVLILRLGGLMGYDRVAGKYTAGKTLAHDAPLNMVHRDDVVAVIAQCINNKIKNSVVNLITPLKQTKKELYDHHAEMYGFEKTYFESLELKGKKVSCEKMKKQIPLDP
jgi:hypothetical protein